MSEISNELIIGVAFHLLFYFLNFGCFGCEWRTGLIQRFLFLVSLFDLLSKVVTVVRIIIILHIFLKDYY